MPACLELFGAIKPVSQDLVRVNRAEVAVKMVDRRMCLGKTTWGKISKTSTRKRMRGRGSSFGRRRL